jgi:hypothetical protein
MHPSYARPPYAPEPPAVSVTRARPWLVGLAATGTMLVIILALGNPPTTRALLRHSLGGFGSRVLQSLSSFVWNFSQLDDPQHFYRANLVFDVVVLVLVLLLVTALAVGTGSFWRTFLSSWVAVIVAVLLAGYVRAALIDPLGTVPGGGIGETTFFSQYSPGPVLLFAAILAGVVAAVVAALVAVTTRKREVVTAPAPFPEATRDDDTSSPTTRTTEATQTTPATQATQSAPAERREPWSAPPAAGVPGPVTEPSPWSTTDEDDRTRALPPVEDEPRSG